MVLTSTFQIIMILLNVLWWLIVVQAILSWLMAFNVINTRSDIVRNIWMTLEKLTEPLYRPIRRFMPDTGALDLTPMVVLIIIVILQQVLVPNLFGALMGAM
jgi:YggT family protein